MTSKSIASLLKTAGFIQTDVGQFSYVKQIGQGGNGCVFHFQKGGSNFAIKFLLSEGGDKEARFKDEFFCASLVKGCSNIARNYHFDVVVLDQRNYFCVVMPLYKGHLVRPKAGGLSADEVSEVAWRLFRHVAEGLRHLHEANVLHRDIKPQNIFISDDGADFIVGDLGIAKFDPTIYPREAETETGDRLANFKFSAPEQSETGAVLTPACDIYALGQLLHWYMTGQVVKGVGRTRFSGAGSSEEMILLDEIVEKCVRSEAAHRFQSISEIYTFIESKERRDPWDAIHRLDDCIRRSFPKVRDVVSTTDLKEISRFFSNFNNSIGREDYWFMSIDGSDNYCPSISALEGERWAFGEAEIELDALIVCRHPSIYGNFFLLIVRPGSPFPLVDASGQPIARDLRGDWAIDAAVMRPDGHYIEESEVSNGYYDNGEAIVPAHPCEFRSRVRHLKPYAYIVGVYGTVLNEGPREITTEFLSDVLVAGNVSAERLKKYFADGRRHLSQRIAAYL